MSSAPALYPPPDPYGALGIAAVNIRGQTIHSFSGILKVLSLPPPPLPQVHGSYSLFSFLSPCVAPPPPYCFLGFMCGQRSTSSHCAIDLSAARQAPLWAPLSHTLDGCSLLSLPPLRQGPSRSCPSPLLLSWDVQPSLSPREGDASHPAHPVTPILLLRYLPLFRLPVALPRWLPSRCCHGILIASISMAVLPPAG